MMKKLLTISNYMVLAGAVVIVIAVSAEFFQNIELGNEGLIYNDVQLAVSFIFLIDYTLRFIAAKEKLRFFLRNIFILLISIPLFNLALLAGVKLPHEWYVILRLLPMIRGGYGITIVVNTITGSKASTLLFSYLSFAIAFAYFSTMLFFYAERGVNSGINSYQDAVWWAAMDITTAGSGIYPVTPLGKILAFTLAATGTMVFPIFTVYISGVIETRHRFRHPKKQQQNLEGRESVKENPKTEPHSELKTEPKKQP